MLLRWQFSPKSFVRFNSISTKIPAGFFAKVDNPYLKCMCVLCAKSLQLCLTVTLWTSLPEPSVHGSLQTKILEWVAFSSSRRFSQLRGQTRVSCVSCIAGIFFTYWATWEAGNPKAWNSQNFWKRKKLDNFHFLILKLNMSCSNQNRLVLTQG